MSNIGNIQLSYGKEINIAVANTYSNIILSGSNLPTNTIIISSNIDEELNDTGSYSMIATDNSGNPVRLTYCIKQGNGLYQDKNNSDVILLNIDNSTIKNNEIGLHIDLSNIKDNTVHTVNNKLAINNSAISISSKERRGILKIDCKTVLLDDALYVNTDSLNYSNNDTFTYGILKSSEGAISLNNGIISLDESKLPKATNDSFGVAKSDEYTTSIKNNIISVNTENLNKASESNYGIISVDNNKINVSNGVLSVNTSNLRKASNKDKGILSIDGNTIKLNDKDQITINRYNDMITKLNELNDELNKEDKSLDNIKNHILSQVK